MLAKPRSDRIDALQKQIKWIEEHYHYLHRLYGNNNIMQLKQELAELLEEAKRFLL
jgi:hypothetical protein